MATLVTQARNRSATTQHLLVEEGVSFHISQWGPKHQDCTVEIIQIRHACNYRYFIQTGGAATSLGIWGIISVDAKQETMWWMGGRLMWTLPRAAWWDRGTINVLRTCHHCGHPTKLLLCVPPRQWISISKHPKFLEWQALVPSCSFASSFQALSEEAASLHLPWVWGTRLWQLPAAGPGRGRSWCRDLQGLEPTRRGVD